MALLAQIVPKDAYEWISNENSKAPRASCILTRLLDDIAGHKFEQEREHVASTVECFMKQFGTSEEETYKEIQVRIEESWKDINEELLGPITVPKPLINQLINLSRVLQDFLNLGEDGYTHPKYMKSKVIAVLIDPIIM
ncbi:probable sesquiterpene synthase [Chenopodium quinoa]|uniref:probable sesquiterpene synthase n=1 Tax=Chenopodium quinoa TaxID=63459 RepID=UPI000B7916C7|nr:probable sesquiterpene synthase [Chenopodium quinoa]